MSAVELCGVSLYPSGQVFAVIHRREMLHLHWLVTEMGKESKKFSLYT